MIDGKNEFLVTTQQYSNWYLGHSCKCHIIAVRVMCRQMVSVFWSGDKAVTKGLSWCEQNTTILSWPPEQHYCAVLPTRCLSLFPTSGNMLMPLEKKIAR